MKIRNPSKNPEKIDSRGRFDHSDHIIVPDGTNNTSNIKSENPAWISAYYKNTKQIDIYIHKKKMSSDRLSEMIDDGIISYYGTSYLSGNYWYAQATTRKHAISIVTAIRMIG